MVSVGVGAGGLDGRDMGLVIEEGESSKGERWEKRKKFSLESTELVLGSQLRLKRSW